MDYSVCLNCNECWSDVKYCTKFKILLFSPKFNIDINKEKCFKKKEAKYD